MLSPNNYYQHKAEGGDNKRSSGVGWEWEWKHPSRKVELLLNMDFLVKEITNLTSNFT
jgi:hypothetical protein